ncbi:hypothetical protein KDK95_16510 [Actinospica sp. MGRD01-02]|uniref:Pycsar effector protein domain-containing protein n=1 Tax=Actinospica acidithermotolerans TaxID=2828514 RepID=A0A941ILT2_9ACTN|nr:Pycsar system effector family protein [Actinospica acidithermotolerans]MBR7827921.1 hypothetical protein [Actinospica acidithermotolerans]
MAGHETANSAVAQVDSAAPGEPERAWRVFDATVQWIAHADGKAGLTLGSAGVVGGVLFSIVGRQSRPDVALVCMAGLCAAAAAAACLFATVALWSRLQPPVQSANPIFFGDIASGYPDAADRDRYTASVLELTRSPERLTLLIAEQVWANSHVARRKYRWVNLALTSLAAALVALAGTCALVYL